MNTTEKIAIMQAFADGENIEYKDRLGTIWTLVNYEPHWDWSQLNYRIQPEIYNPQNTCNIVANANFIDKSSVMKVNNIPMHFYQVNTTQGIWYVLASSPERAENQIYENGVITNGSIELPIRIEGWSNIMF